MGKMKVGMMVDFETLGVSGDSVVLSAGAVAFTKTNVLDERYWEFDVIPQLVAGRTVDKSTQDWWIKQNLAEYSRLLESGVNSLDDFVGFFLAVWREWNCDTIWTRGNMDLKLLDNLMEVPYGFYQARDVRTLDEFGTMENNGHNALKDCLNQIEFVQGILPKE